MEVETYEEVLARGPTVGELTSITATLVAGEKDWEPKTIQKAVKAAVRIWHAGLNARWAWERSVDDQGDQNAQAPAAGGSGNDEGAIR